MHKSLGHLSQRKVGETLDGCTAGHWYSSGCEQGVKGRRQALPGYVWCSAVSRPSCWAGMSQQKRWICVPVQGLSGCFYLGELCFLAPGEPPKTQDPPISEFLTNWL